MATIYLYTFASVLLISLISLVGIFVLLVNERVLRKLVFLLVSLAVGAFLGNVFIYLIPEAFAESTNITLTSVLFIVGMLAFFVLEKFLHWQHSHVDKESAYHHHEELKEVPNKGKIRPLGYMILASDGLHNFIDGIIIGTSYLISIDLGIATTVAVIIHEIPQEISDFGVLLHAGFSRARALFFNFLSALFAVGGALIALIASSGIEGFAGWVIPLAAGGFLYIAGSDLIPELHKTKDAKSSLLQFAAIVVGVLAMLLLLVLEI